MKNQAEKIAYNKKTKAFDRAIRKLQKTKELPKDKDKKDK